MQSRNWRGGARPVVCSGSSATPETKPVSLDVLETALRTVGNPQVLLTAQSRASDAVDTARENVK
jgi:hypothetical protein